MALKTRIDFNKRYVIDAQSHDFKSSFKTELLNGEQIDIHVQISDDPHEILPNVYNLAFGPLNKQDRIDDTAKLAYADYSKVFSTILFNARMYLSFNPDHFLGVDGSTNARAYLYYRFIRRNYDYLDQYFNMYGMKYYVRITRFGKRQYDNPFDFQDFSLMQKSLKMIYQRRQNLCTIFSSLI